MLNYCDFDVVYLLLKMDHFSFIICVTIPKDVHIYVYEIVPTTTNSKIHNSFRLIVYDPWMKQISGLKHELSMTFYPETFSSYSPRSGLYMKFRSNIKNIKGRRIYLGLFLPMSDVESKILYFAGRNFRWDKLSYTGQNLDPARINFPARG